MRVLVKDVIDDSLMLIEPVSAYVYDSITVDTERGPVDFEFENVLVFEMSCKDTVNIIMNKRDVNATLMYLLEHGTVDLTMYGKYTFIYPSAEDLDRLEEVSQLASLGQTLVPSNIF